jgi:hypothetical protein
MNGDRKLGKKNERKRLDLGLNFNSLLLRFFSRRKAAKRESSVYLIKHKKKKTIR